MPKRKKINSDNAFGYLFELLIIGTLLGLRYLLLYMIEVLKFIVIWTWRILIFIVRVITDKIKKRKQAKIQINMHESQKLI